MRDSNSSKGYTVLNGLGCIEARIAVGELSMVPVARAGSTMAQSRTKIVYMMLPLSRWDLCLDAILLGGEVLTEEDFLGFSIYVGGMSFVGLRLAFDLTKLGELSTKTILALSCPAGLVCEAAPLTKLAAQVSLT